MQQILLNFNNPTWWFNGIFFIVLGILIAWLFKKTPTLLKKYFRNRRAKTLKKIKLERWCSSAVQYQINQAQTRFLLFVFSCFGFILLLVSSNPEKSIFQESFALGMVLTSPIYIIEFYWLFKDTYVKELIRSKRKLRITSKLTRT